MKIKPLDIAKSLADCLESNAKLSLDEACESAVHLLKRTCPGVPPRQLVKLLERELKKRGHSSAGLLIVPTDRSISASSVSTLLKKKSGKPMPIERKTDPEIIGGAILLADHRRIDCSIQGALASLLHTCLQPLD